jgi:hypothetical protein
MGRVWGGASRYTCLLVDFVTYVLYFSVMSSVQAHLYDSDDNNIVRNKPNTLLVYFGAWTNLLASLELRESTTQ